MVPKLNLYRGGLYYVHSKATMRGWFLVYWTIWDLVCCRNEDGESPMKGVQVWYCKTRCVMAWSVVDKNVNSAQCK